jgi:hypothetical protein
MRGRGGASFMGALPVGRHGLRARLTDLALAGRNEERSIGLSGNRRGRPGVLRFEQSIPREGESNAHPEFGTWTSWEPLPRRPRASTRRERGGAGPPGACLPDAAVAGRRRRERVPTDLALCAGWSLSASISRGRRKPARRRKMQKTADHLCAGLRGNQLRRRRRQLAPPTSRWQWGRTARRQSRHSCAR